MATYRLRESGKAAWWAEISLHLRDELNTVLIQLEQSQAAIRGYALTGEEEFLGPYKLATNNLAENMERLRWYAGTQTGRQRETLARIESLTYQRLDDFKSTIALALSEGTAAAQKRISQGGGDRLQQQCRELIDNFRKEHILVQKANLLADRASRGVALQVVLAGSVMSFALVLLSFVLLQRQIRQRDLAEGAARESEERLQMALRGVRAGVWYAQTEPHTVFWSPEFRELYGFSPDEPASDERWRKSVHPEDLPRVERDLQFSLQGRLDEWQTEFRITAPNREERWILALVRVWRNAHGKPERLGGINLDITERKQVELQLAQTQRLLREHSDQLEQTVHERTAKLKDTITELESFSYIVSHDLRNPLRAMHGCAELVLNEYGGALPSDGHTLLERIIHAAKRMDGLTLELLSYSRVARSEIQCGPIHVERMITEVIDLNPALRATGVEIVIVRPLEKMIGHEPLLRHCLANLLDNAVKYVAPGVSPRIRIRAERRPASFANAAGEQSSSGLMPPHSFIRLWVEDNGIGIDARFHQRIFGIFERLFEHPSEGAGAGLAIVAKAVERMGGKYGVESAAGCGSRFWIELPAAMDHESVPATGM